ncbi:MAG: NfeD family protein [Actinomycetia bacterium]|nr:NfeD family protein [Actinomycetes bacterium]MCP4226759.1 NfeD family protein [Actinomycetes bacterium]MCP5035227.1 NfeD family protein [Actinomycetes bacterium]
MDNPTVWAVIWLALTAGFGVGELLMAGTFFLLPFALGALVAAIVSLLGAPLIVSFPVFLVSSLGAFFGMRPLAKRLEASTPEVAGIGANRLLGVAGTVIEAITAMDGQGGMVKIGTEEWKADSAAEFGLPVGMTIRVLEVRGTRLVVEPTELSDLQELS